MFHGRCEKLHPIVNSKYLLYSNRLVSRTSAYKSLRRLFETDSLPYVSIRVGCNRRMFHFRYFVFAFVAQFIQIKAQFYECNLQRQQLFQCLTKLNTRKDRREISLIKDALTEDDAEAQSFWISQWQRATNALEKCRILDPEFDWCAPKSRITADLTNRTSYLYDKIQCVENASLSENIMSLKESFGRQIELQCFGTSAPPAERPCQPNSKVKSCLAYEMTTIKPTYFNFTTVTEVSSNDTNNNDTSTGGSEQFYQLFDVSRNDRRKNYWECYECLHLASEQCRPTKRQRNCILTQKKPITNVYKKNLKKCMESKGYIGISNSNYDEFELLAQIMKPSDSDFCYSVSEEIYIR